MQRRTVAGADIGRELLMQTRYLGGTGRLAFPAKIRNEGLYGTTVAWVIHSADQRVSLEPVDELRHV